MEDEITTIKNSPVGVGLKTSCCFLENREMLSPMDPHPFSRGPMIDATFGAKNATDWAPQVPYHIRDGFIPPIYGDFSIFTMGVPT